MKNLPIISLALLVAGVAVAINQEGLVSRGPVAGTTSATVHFPSGAHQGRVVLLDATSDKASSVAAFYTGTNNTVLYSAAVANDTNLITYGTALVAANIILVENSSSQVTNQTVATVTAVTNKVITFDTTLNTNLASGDLALKRLSTPYVLWGDASASATNYTISLTNGLSPADLVVAQSRGLAWVGTVYSVASNRLNLDQTLGIALTAYDTTFYKLTNLYTVQATTAGTSSQVRFDNSTNLTGGDVLLVAPTSGGFFLKTFVSSENLILNTVALTTSVGIAMTAGDRLSARSLIQSTPVGATTLRRDGTLWIVPPHQPAQIILDGTSACTLNQVIVDYGR